jgi:short-subunit dehydrogenase
MIVVTGGSKGIGRAIVEKFAAAGHTVATCGRNMETLKQLKSSIESQYGTKLFVQTADLSVKEDTATFIDFVKRIGEPVDVLVNNTGVFLPGELHNEADGLLETMIDTNLYSAYRVTRGLISGMMERKSGHIFNICSIASITAYANGGSYAISKHALYGFSKCLRQEMKVHGVRVTSVMPGPTYTDSWAGVDLPQERFSTSEDVADLVFATWQLSGRSVVEDLVIRPQLGDL